MQKATRESGFSFVAGREIDVLNLVYYAWMPKSVSVEA